VTSDPAAARAADTVGGDALEGDASDGATSDGDAPTGDALAERRAALDRLRRFGGERLVRSMGAVFLAAMPERLDAARGALADGDFAGVAGAAHGLRASCAQFGAGDAARLGAALEEAAGRADRGRCAALLEAGGGRVRVVPGVARTGAGRRRGRSRPA
jgi:HPt (histidine-containing phosphotransfer) domain-containing protein